MKASQVVKLCNSTLYWSTSLACLENFDVLTLAARFNAKWNRKGRITLLPFEDMDGKLSVSIEFSPPKEEEFLELQEVVFLLKFFICLEGRGCSVICSQICQKYKLEDKNWCYKVED